MNAKEVLLRKKLLGFSILFHISLVVIAMTTYFTMEKINEMQLEDQMSYMEIQFTNSSKSSGMGSTKKNLEKTPKEKATARAIEEKVVKVEPLEETENEKNSEVDKKQVKKAKVDAESASSKTEGDGDSGKMLTGVALGNLDFDGDGVFGRKVVYHAPIKKIAEQDGRIAINMGINRAGKVVGAAVNKEHSTINNRQLLIKALEMALKYEFEADYTAPKVQYGKFTFIVNLNKK